MFTTGKRKPYQWARPHPYSRPHTSARPAGFTPFVRTAPKNPIPHTHPDDPPPPINHLPSFFKASSLSVPLESVHKADIRPDPLFHQRHPGGGPHRPRDQARQGFRMRPAAPDGCVYIGNGFEGYQAYQNITPAHFNFPKMNPRPPKSPVVPAEQEPVDPDDAIFEKQMARLRLDRDIKREILAFQDIMERADAEAPRRAAEQARRDARVEKMVAEEREMEAKRKREEAERRQQKLEEDIRQALQRQVQDRIRRQEEEERRKEVERVRKEQEMQRQREEEQRRFAEEMRRKQAAWEREKQERLEREREEAERRRQQRLHDIRQLREAARAVLNATHASRTKDQFELHDRKWTAIKDNAVDVECIAFEHIPWPVLDVVVTTPAEITRARIEQFVFHPMRTGVDGKSRKERVRADLLKWHPDKFNSKVMGKTSEWERDMVTEAAGFVAKTLTQLLSEEVARERA